MQTTALICMHEAMDESDKKKPLVDRTIEQDE